MLEISFYLLIYPEISNYLGDMFANTEIRK